LLEVQIAFALLGVGLAGFCPFVVMQLRQLVNLEGNLHAADAQHATPYISPSTPNSQRGRLQAYTFIHNSYGMQTTTNHPQQIHCIVPWNNPWGRKLISRAQCIPGPWPPSGGSLDPAVSAPSKGYFVTLSQAPTFTYVNGVATKCSLKADVSPN
jgi:hypothetical protein